MLVLGIVLILIGCLVAALLERTIGVFLAVIGLVLVVIALVSVGDADASTQLAWSSWS